MPRKAGARAAISQAQNTMYERVGRAVIDAVMEIMQNLPGRATNWDDYRNLEVEALRDDLDHVHMEIADLHMKLGHLLEEVKRLRGPETPAAGPPQQEPEPEPVPRPARRGRAAKPPKRRTRMPKEQIREQALQAARALAGRGEEVTMTSVAKEAGLRPNQVTYAFGRRETLIKDLEATFSRASS